jgi:parallel beta-helix repeat protein
MRNKLTGMRLRMRAVAIATVTLLVVATLGAGLVSCVGEEGVPGKVVLEVGPGKDYATIQAAVDDAEPGWTVLVYPGTYEENVTVNKAGLTLKSNDGPEVTTVKGIIGSVIEVVADGVTIDGFSMTNGEFGIFVNSDGNTMVNNIANNTTYGISLRGGRKDNAVTGNDITDCSTAGIDLLAGTSNNLIDSNEVSGSGVDGIRLTSSSGNTITGNTVTGSGEHNINLATSDNNIITNNVVSGSTLCGIQLHTSHNNILDNNTSNDGVFWAFGITLRFSNNNIITNNTCLNNDWGGILLDNSCNNNVIYNNGIDGGDIWGIAAYRWCNHNVITKNSVANIFFYGIDLSEAANHNVVTGNNVTGSWGAGIILGNEGSESEYNQIQYNSVTDNLGLGVHVATNVTSVVISYNNIVGNLGGGLQNDGDLEVDARYNWWGNEGGPGVGGANNVTGLVIYDPWLDAPV